jgi:endonuclease/exonuclease/phosphatase (EEP) superfamily protein YafD
MRLNSFYLFNNKHRPDSHFKCTTRRHDSPTCQIPVHSAMKTFISFILILPLLALLGGWLGSFHAAGDSLAVFRIPLTLLGIVSVCSLSFMARYYVVSPALILVLATAFSLAAYVGKNPSNRELTYRHYQKNLSFRIASLKNLIADIHDQRPDFLSLQEVTAKNREILSRISRLLPSQHDCPFASVGGVAVASSWPVVNGSKYCAKNQGLAAMQVVTNNGPVWVISIHLHWPWPYRQHAQVDRLIEHLSKLNGPKVIGGDFNMVAWSHTLREIQKISGSVIANGYIKTLPLLGGIFSLPIDHILVSEKSTVGRVSGRPFYGSDHRGLIAEFDLPSG